MASLEQFQRTFAEALHDPALPPPPAVARRDGVVPVRRFNVYRNNVYARLIGVLEARFPAVRRLVGEEFFRAMARLFIDSHPAGSPVLINYGAALPDFIDAFEPASDVPYLCDVARIEWLIHRAYHAADCAALTPQDFSAIPIAEAAQLGVTFAPAVAFLDSRYPAYSIWRANARPEDGSDLPPNLGSEQTMIARRDLVVEAIRLPRGAFQFATALADGKPLAEAGSIAASLAVDFRLDVSLALLIQQGAITAVVLPGRDLPEQ